MKESDYPSMFAVLTDTVEVDSLGKKNRRYIGSTVHTVQVGFSNKEEARKFANMLRKTYNIPITKAEISGS